MSHLDLQQIRRRQAAGYHPTALRVIGVKTPDIRAITKDVIKRLKKLLDNLGEFNDISVQVESIEGFARQMAEEGKYPSRSLIAMGACWRKLSSPSGLCPPSTTRPWTATR